MVEFRVAMMCTCTYPQRTAIPLQGLDRCALVLTVGAISRSHCQTGAPHGTISPVVDLNGQQNALWKSRPVDISQWRQ